MKTFTYVAAIALLAAGTAFAQAQSNTNGANGGANGSTINNSTPTPGAKGAAEGVPRGSSGTSSGTMMNRSGSGVSGSMDRSSSGSSMGSGSMNQSSNIDHSMTKKSSRHASKTRTHHVARNMHSSNADARENQETMRLNRQQVAGAPSGMNSSGGMYGSGMSGSTSSGMGNPFNNGSPQQAQGGGLNCTPDNPSCGTARQNPAIKSSPQQRVYPEQHR